MSNAIPSESPPPPASPPRRRVALHWKILIGLLLGAVLGIAAHAHFARPQQAGIVDALDQDANGVDDQLDRFALNVADPIGRVFLRLVLMVVLPLVISALALAVVELGDLRRLGRVGLRTLIYTLFLSSVAVLIGITLVNTLPARRAVGASQAGGVEGAVLEGRRRLGCQVESRQTAEGHAAGHHPGESAPGDGRGVGRQFQGQRDHRRHVLRPDLRRRLGPGRRSRPGRRQVPGRHLRRLDAHPRLGDAAGAAGRRLPGVRHDVAIGRRIAGHAGLVRRHGAAGICAPVVRRLSAAADRRRPPPSLRSSFARSAKSC